MDNQHQHIRGYRELTPADIALMNSIKRQEANTIAILREAGRSFRNILDQECFDGVLTREVQNDKLTTHISLMGKAVDHLMIGYMLAVRSIAQPQPLQEEKTPHIPWRAVDASIYENSIPEDASVWAIQVSGGLAKTTFQTIKEALRDATVLRQESCYSHFCLEAEIPLPAEG